MTTNQTIDARAVLTYLILAGAMISGCSKTEAPAAKAPGDSSASAPGRGTGSTAVRGTIAVLNDTMMVVSTPAGDINVALTAPPEVFSRGPADISEVTGSSFVGVTSVAQPDGSQRATEIHIFPDALRGTNEGSFLMRRQPGADSQSTMTNGTVEPPRMTNGTASGMSEGKLVVNYRGGSQTIIVPSGVTVTKISRVETKLAPGSNVVVLATKRPNGTLTASRVLLAPR